MITRIVKLSFQNQYCPHFESMFPKIQQIVFSSKGCKEVKLLKSMEKGLYFTYSHWDTEQSLEDYRQSDVFKKIWSDFKTNFKDAPQAWSTVDISPVI